ncbi:hypothetical protein JL721_3765 [Aureococcus anophagefferens]|nr:hypothetical protein JL721_3765 [Aureococcus anophagefferens]
MVERRSPRKRISFGFPSGELRINPLADEDCEVARPVDDAVATPVLTAGWAPALLRHRVATDPDTPRSSVAASPYPLEASLAFPAGLTFDELLGDLGAPAGDLVVPNCFTCSRRSSPVALPVFVEAHGRRHLAAFVFEQIRAVVQLRDARYPEFLKAAAARGDLDLGDPGRRHTRAALASYDRCSPEPPVEYLDLVSIGGCHVLEGAPALPEAAPELHRAVETRAYGRVARAIADGDVDVACGAGDTALHVVARLLSTEAVLDHEPVWFDYAALCLELLHRGAALRKNGAGDTPASALPTRRALRHLLYGTASALDPLKGKARQLVAFLKLKILSSVNPTVTALQAAADLRDAAADPPVAWARALDVLAASMSALASALCELKYEPENESEHALLASLNDQHLGSGVSETMFALLNVDDLQEVQASALDVAMESNDKRFIAHPGVVSVVDAIWNGDVCILHGAHRTAKQPGGVSQFLYDVTSDVVFLAVYMTTLLPASRTYSAASGASFVFLCAMLFSKYAAELDDLIVRSDGRVWEYCSDPWNLIDVASILSMTQVLALLRFGSESTHAFAYAAAVSLTTEFTRLLYFIPIIFPQMGPILRIAQLMVKDVINFCVIMTLLVVGNGAGLYVLVKREESFDDDEDPECESSTFARLGKGGWMDGGLGRSIFVIFQAALGEYDFSCACLNMDPKRTVFVRIFYCASIVISNVMLLNLLIAMMSSTYDRVTEDAEIEGKFLRAKIVHYSSQLTLPRPFNALQIAHRIARKVCQRAPRESATALLKSDGGSIGGRRATKVAEHVATAASALLVELAGRRAMQSGRVFNLIFARSSA